MTLPSIQTAQGKIGLVELDLAPQLAELIGLDLSLPDNVKTIQEILEKIGRISAVQATGLVVDPIYSFGIAQTGGKAGFLTRLTAFSEVVDPVAVPALIPNYGLEEMRNNYSLAELELYYHPQEENALIKKQLLAEIYDYCDYLDIDLLLKLIVYSPANHELTQESFQQDQLQAVQELRSTADVLALQYPLDPLAVATMTAELDIPWILQTQAQSYEEYKKELRICLENGAVGFTAGVNLWREIKKFKLADKSPDLASINQFFETIFQDRLIELMRITQES